MCDKFLRMYFYIHVDFMFFFKFNLARKVVIKYHGVTK